MHTSDWTCSRLEVLQACMQCLEYSGGDMLEISAARDNRCRRQDSRCDQSQIMRALALYTKYLYARTCAYWLVLCWAMHERHEHRSPWKIAPTGGSHQVIQLQQSLVGHITQTQSSTHYSLMSDWPSLHQNSLCNCSFPPDAHKQHELE